MTDAASNRRTLWLKVWCDGSADPERGRIAWACVSSGIEDHGTGADAHVSFGVGLGQATSMVAEACAVAAGIKLGRRIGAALEAAGDDAPEVRLHIVSDCDSIVQGVREAGKPRGIPVAVWGIIREARQAGAVFAHAPRCTTPELKFVDRLAHTALSKTEQAKEVARTSTLASTLMRSLEISKDEAEALQAAIEPLLPRRPSAPPTDESFAIRVGRDADGALRIVETRGAVPRSGGRSILPRLIDALVAHEARDGAPEDGAWLRPRQTSRRWRFDPVEAAPAAEATPRPALGR